MRMWNRSARTTHRAFRFALCRSSSSNSSLRWDHDFGIAVGGLGTPGGRDKGGIASRSAVLEGPASVGVWPGEEVVEVDGDEDEEGDEDVTEEDGAGESELLGWVDARRADGAPSGSARARALGAVWVCEDARYLSAGRASLGAMLMLLRCG